MNKEGHGFNHIKTLIESSMEFTGKQNVDINMAYTIVLYYDLGYHIIMNQGVGILSLMK